MSRKVSATDFRSAEQCDFGVKSHGSLGIVYQSDLEIVGTAFMRPMVDAYQTVARLSTVARGFTDIADPVDPSKAGVKRRITGSACEQLRQFRERFSSKVHSGVSMRA
jgi:hypothetical protein